MDNLPKLNLNYWLLMLLCTTMGELAGNFLSRNLELGYTKGAILDIAVLTAMVTLVLGLRLTNEFFYWLLILLGNVAGTNLADWVTLEPLANDKTWGFLKPLELGTKAGSFAVMSALIGVLLMRKRLAYKIGERAFIVGSLYWLAILLSSTFGTTSGDLITNDTPLGALGGSIFLMIALMCAFTAERFTFISKLAAYWIALVLVHPIGATIGNWVSKPIGLDLGNVYTSLAMVIAFIGIYIMDGRARANPGTERSFNRR